MDNMKHRRLQEMDRSDFGVVDGEPDIRGWDVRLSSGQKVGEVEELIVDAQKRKVRYMVVDRSDNELDLQDYNVLIPIGLARLDQDDDDVTLPGIKAEQLNALPAYDADHLDAKMEQMTCIALGLSKENKETTGGEHQHNARIVEHDDSFYENEHFNDSNLFKNRMHKPQPVSHDQDYQGGIRLWEIRSEGTTTTGDTNRMGERNREMSEEERMEMVRNRRRSYEDRRGSGGTEDGDYRNSTYNRRDDRNDIL